MTIKKWVLTTAVLVTLSGCAFGDAHLDIAYDKSKAIAGPLSNIPAQKITIGKFADERQETGLVGYKRNGFGQHTADIKPDKPVSAIVRNAVAAVFQKGGQHVVDGSPIVVSGDIKTFWFDTKVGFWTVDFMGNAAIHLVVTDSSTSRVIYEHDYQGAYTEESMGGLEKTWQRVMNKALSKLCENISLDTSLAEALKKHATDSASQVLSKAN